MQADALRPVNSGLVGNDEGEGDDGPLRMGTGADPDRTDLGETVAVWPEETLLQVADYLRLNVSRFHFINISLDVHRFYSRLRSPVSYLV